MVANAGVVLWKPIVESKCFWKRMVSLGSYQLIASVEDFDRVMAVNVKGTFLCVKLAGEQMIKQGNGGRIIG